MGLMFYEPNQIAYTKRKVYLMLGRFALQDVIFYFAHFMVAGSNIIHVLARCNWGLSTSSMRWNMVMHVDVEMYDVYLPGFFFWRRAILASSAVYANATQLGMFVRNMRIVCKLHRISDSYKASTSLCGGCNGWIKAPRKRVWHTEVSTCSPLPLHVTLHGGGGQMEMYEYTEHIIVLLVCVYAPVKTGKGRIKQKNPFMRIN